MMVFSNISYNLDTTKSGESQKDLIDACKNGDIKKFLLILDQNPNIDVNCNNLNNRGMLNIDPPFITACKYGHIEIVKLLLDLKDDRYVDVHVEEEYAFRLACYGGHLEIVKLLLSLKGNRYINIHHKYEHGFYLAGCYGHYEIVNLLLSLHKDSKWHQGTDNRYIGDDADMKGLVIRACRKSYYNIVELLISHGRFNPIEFKSMVIFTNDVRLNIVIIMINRLLKKRREELYKRKIQIYKRLYLREIKCLPDSYLYKNFPGGTDYLKIIYKYSAK